MTERNHPLDELELESTIGGIGTDADRELPVISLADLDTRRAEITDQLWRAATDVGFFQLSDHGIPQHPIDDTFAAAADFFALPTGTKAHYPWRRELNASWESKTQVRPSTLVADQKESYQMTRPHMDGLWPTDDEVPGFRTTLLETEVRCW